MKIISDMFEQPGGWIAPYHVRNRLVNQYIFVFAACGHTLFIPIFYMLGRDIPFYNNIICVGVDLFCVYLNYRWKLRTVYLIFSSEILYHTFFCTIIFGWETGFIIYFFSVSAYLFLQRKHDVLRNVMFAVLVVLFVMQYIYIKTSPPEYPATIIPVWLIYALNVTANLSAIALISSQFSLFVDYAEKAIMKAKRKAEEGERAKSAFLANMSHEIRSPLNSIIGMINLALLEAKDYKKNEYLYIARSSADHLLTVINDILDYSKIEVKMMTLNFEVFNIHHLVRNTMIAMDSSIYDRDLDMKYEVSESVPRTVSGDPSRIRQVLINLINNAVKFTESGSVTLRCRNISGDEDPCMVEFQVEDTGIGIPEDKIDRIFERFSQIECGQTGRYRGTGLGLSISRELVELMGGSIYAESRPGTGSIFTFTIPLQRAVMEEKKPMTKTVSPDAVDTGRLKVLIAEDVFTNWLLYEKYMEMLGHSYKIVENGRMVLDELEQNSYDIVLMDMEMPEMGGEETVKNIREGVRGVNRSIPVIAISGYSENDFHKLDEGFDGFVPKPVELEELDRMIYEIIYQKPDRDPD